MCASIHHATIAHECFCVFINFSSFHQKQDYLITQEEVTEGADSTDEQDKMFVLEQHIIEVS